MTADSTLLSSGLVVAERQGQQTLVQADILLKGGRIAEIRAWGHSGAAPAETVIDASGCLVTPGFIDLHAHLTDTPYTRGWLEDPADPRLGASGLYEFLPRIRRAIEPEDEVAAVQPSLVDLLRSGVTTVVEMPFQSEVRSGGDLAVARQIAEKAADVGVRLYLGPRVKSADWEWNNGDVAYRWHRDRGVARLADVVAFLDSLESMAMPVKPFLAPGQVDTSSEELLRAIDAIARDRGWMVQIHAGQSAAEYREMFSRHAMSGVAWMDELGILGPHLILGHAVFLSHHSSIGSGFGDLELLAEREVAVAHCPMVLGRRGVVMESLAEYRQRGIRLGLGTDTFPLDFISEMRTAALLGHVATNSPSSPSAADLLDAGTAVAARIIGRADLGRIIEGAAADLVVWKMGLSHDPIRDLVYGQPLASARDVFVEGRLILHDGHVTTVNERAVRSDLSAAAERVWQRIELDGLVQPSLPAGEA